MSNARQGWNAAQLASERKPVNRKVLASVGKPLSWLETPLADSACKHCGYHICCCTWNDPPRLQADAAPAALVNKSASCNAPNCCCDKCWAELKPALLTYDQAVAACLAGREVSGEETYRIRFNRYEGFEYQANTGWVKCAHFGAVDPGHVTNWGYRVV